MFRRRSRVLHLPRLQERAGGGFLSCFDVIHASSSSSLVCNSEPELDFWCFEAVLAFSTSLTFKSSPEVDLWPFHHRSHHLHLPRMHEQAGAGFMMFRHSSCLLHLPRMQYRAVLHLPPPSRARASWRSYSCWMGCYLKLVPCIFPTTCFFTKPGAGFLNPLTLRKPVKPFQTPTLTR